MSQRTVLAGLEVDASPATRVMYAFDASNYQVPPAGVALPRDLEEVQALLAASRENEIPVTCRGTGTSMARKAVGKGVVIDFSRHANRVISVDEEARTITVEPGLVLDDLQRFLKPVDLMFAPDPSSHSRATIGGMIGNDACGNHSVKYGRTVEHVIALHILLSDGSRLIAEAGENAASVERAVEINGALRTLASDSLAAIRLELGRIPRQVSGYQLQWVLPDNGFDIAMLLTRTEGACAVVVGATLALVPTPRSTLLVALGYRTVSDAATDVPEILRFRPSSIEGMDQTIVDTMRQRLGPESVVGLPAGQSWLLVDFEGPDLGTLRGLASELLVELHRGGRLLDGRPVPAPTECLSLGNVRENGAGLATRRADGTQTWAGCEDSAVAPERLAAYRTDLGRLLYEHGLSGAFYGHFGAGCVHVRIDFDVASAVGVERMRAYVLEAARLVRSYDGSASGEHGDGRSRSELLTIQYSPEVLSGFARVKRAFDPIGLLNPDIIVAPAPLSSGLIPIGTTSLGPIESSFSFPDDAAGFAGATKRCVGIGRCRSDNDGDMCPSYRGTHDVKDSTSGRARALQDMIRGTVITTAGVPRRSWRPWTFACRTRPARVSVPSAPIWRPTSPSSSTITTGDACGRVRTTPWAGGITPLRAVPQFAPRSRRRAARQPSALPRDVVVFVDTFTAGFRPEHVGAATRALQDAALTCDTVEGLCCGLTWISTGQLSRAKRVLSRTITALDSADQVPIVVLEPSCAAALIKDATDLLGTDAAIRASSRIRSFAQLVEQQLDSGWIAPQVEASCALQVPCHESAVFGAGALRRALTRLVCAPIVESEGCCGLAGNFGFERDHYETSMDVADLSLGPILSSLGERSLVLAHDFSCQQLISHLTGADAQAPLHLAELIDSALRHRNAHPTHEELG